MTATEWLINAMENPHKHNNINWENIKEQAKEMEKQQIIEAYESKTVLTGNQYYQETFKNQIK
jgi:hypothetical protein